MKATAKISRKELESIMEWTTLIGHDHSPAAQDFIRDAVEHERQSGSSSRPPAEPLDRGPSTRRLPAASSCAREAGPSHPLVVAGPRTPHPVEFEGAPATPPGGVRGRSAWREFGTSSRLS